MTSSTLSLRPNVTHLLRAAVAAVFPALASACAASSEAPPHARPPEPSAEGDAQSPPTDAVHVSPLGDDTNPGTAERPMRSFVEAIAVARAGSRHLTLCSGVFTEPLVLNAARGADAFTVEGGAACLGLSAAASVVRTTDAPALELFAIGGPVRIARVTFERESVEVPGTSAVAGAIAFVEDVRLANVTLRAGRGAPGAAGQTVAVEPCGEPIDPRTPSHVGAGGRGATYAGQLLGPWMPTPGEDGGVLRFPRSSRCVEPAVRAGAGGTGGGASLALTVRTAHVTLDGVVLTSSDAGRGGDGGNAQAPGCDPLAQKSCEVLDIGGGGGGAGGVSAALLSRDAVFDIDPSTRFAVGAAGAGGSGGRGARWLHGSAGVAGVTAPTLEAEALGPEATP
jgi:hypothetical protein